MKAFIVSVGYSDILNMTLPYNRHHFQEVYIITSSEDAKNVDPIAGANRASVIVTDLFYADGGHFRKWLALEYSLDQVGRDGEICFLDSDIMWPKIAPLKIEVGKLYCPLRRMFEDTTKPIPHEAVWDTLPLHTNIQEWAGYSQCFSGSDPVLQSIPWFDTSWTHAGGADSFFQRRWERQNKIRPDFEVLHIGPAGANWFGRSTPYLDGTLPEDAEERKRLTEKLWSGRRVNSRHGPDRFRGEKIL